MEVRGAVLGGALDRHVLREDVQARDRVDVGSGQGLEGRADARSVEDVDRDDHELEPPAGDAAPRVDLGDREGRAVAHLQAVAFRRSGERQRGSDQEGPPSRSARSQRLGERR